MVIKGNKSVVKIVIPIIIIALIFNCKKYPAGSVVDLKFNCSYQDTTAFNKLFENLMMVLSAFAKENKDFSIFTAEKDSPDDITHQITVNVDTIILIDYQKYKAALDSVNPELDNSLKGISILSGILPGNGLAGIAGRENARAGLSSWAINNKYGSSLHARLFYRLEVRDIQKGEDLISHFDTLRVYSNTPILKKDQLQQLISVLFGAIRERLPFCDY